MLTDQPLSKPAIQGRDPMIWGKSPCDPGLRWPTKKTVQSPESGWSDALLGISK